MKKLIFALSAALLLLSACGEKTKKYEFNGAEITYPASWTVEESGSRVSIQDPKVEVNFADIVIYELEQSSMSSEELAESLQNMVYSVYSSLDEDYNISFETEIQGTDTQAMVTFSGTDDGKDFSATIMAWYDESYSISAFYSGKNAAELSKIMKTFKVEF